MTKTSAFGVSGREGHDSSGFYGSRMMKPRSAMMNNLYEKWDGQGTGWMDRIYLGSSSQMLDIPDNSVGLAFTSPPYAVGKEYDEDLTLEEWEFLMSAVADEVHRVLVPGGRYVVNVANIGRKPYVSLVSSVYKIMTDWHPFACQGEIIWRKAKGAGGNCAWGSWNSAKAPSLRDVHEYLLVFTKGQFGRPDKGISDMTKEEFMASTLSIWDIPPASAKRIGHPAPFPLALADRVIGLYSYVGDVVLDPFMGSGTTCLAAAQRGRRYVGFDTEDQYVKLAEERIDKWAQDQ
jgi:DNA modification methylase